MSYQERGYYWSEAIPDILSEYGVNLDSITPTQWDEIAEALDENVSNAQDFMAPVPSRSDIAEMNYRPEREAMQKEIKRLTERLQAYNDDIVRVKGGAYTDIEHGRVVIYNR